MYWGVQLPALERWTTLERLVLDQCGLLTHLSLSLPRLHTVSLRHCRALANVTLAPSCSTACTRLSCTGEALLVHFRASWQCTTTCDCTYNFSLRWT